MGYTRDTVKGISWLGSFRIVTRGMSFVRTVVLARFLTPTSFGVFGIATLVLSFLEILTETGINILLVQKKVNIDSYINTAFVISIIRGVIISLVILASAPFVALFFRTPDVLPLLLLTSLVPLIRGFINPSVAKFVKDLEFKKEFLYRTTAFFVETVITLWIVISFESLYGLVIGLIAGAMFEVTMSFLIARPLPVFRYERTKFREIIGRGKWLTLTGIFNYLYHNGDDMIVGRVLGTTSLGLYQMSYKISMLPISEIADVVSRATFPVYVKIAEDRERLQRAYMRSVFLVSFFVIPMGLLFFFFPEQVISIILGNQWLGAANVLRVLALFGVVRAISMTVIAPLYALEKQESVTIITLISLGAMAITILPYIYYWGLMGAGLSALTGSLVALPVIIYFLRRDIF